MDFSNIIIAVLGLVGALAGTYFGNSKTTALILYRLDALEQKQNKHNSIVERTYAIEKEQEKQHIEIETVKDEVKDLKETVEELRKN